MSLIATKQPSDHIGHANVKCTFKSKSQNFAYDADFSAFQVPSLFSDRFTYDADKGVITFKDKMTLEELDKLSIDADDQQKWALKNLHYKSNWSESKLHLNVIVPIKQLRSWAFVLSFLYIGLSTRFKDLAIFGLKPFWAFTIGALVNLPLGYLLTTKIFTNYWRAIN